MTADELRALQAPLKQRYREQPEAARVTSRAEVRLAEDAVACEVVGRAPPRAGLHPAAGGDGREACSADMLLEALAACAGVTLRAVATAGGVRLGGRIVAEGVWDARGTLGVDRSVPVGIGAVSLTFALDSDAPRERLESLVATAERYCVILQTLRQATEVTVRIA